MCGNVLIFMGSTTFVFFSFCASSSFDSSSSVTSLSSAAASAKVSSSLFKRFPLIRNFPFSAWGTVHTHTHTPFISYDRFSLDNPDKTSETDANLRRWEICGHAITQRRGDECTAKDGAHVAGHDFLLFHAAVVLQGENHWILGCLRKSRQPPPKQTHI